jgi:hypothetical protein
VRHLRRHKAKGREGDRFFNCKFHQAWNVDDCNLGVPRANNERRFFWRRALMVVSLARNQELPARKQCDASTVYLGRAVRY